MYKKVLDDLNEMIDEIIEDQKEIEEQSRDAIYYIMNSRSLEQGKLAIKMLAIVAKRRSLLRDRTSFVKKTLKEINKRIKRAGL